MLWRTSSFRALGGFDERYFLYCEDVDICLRLQLSGQHFTIVEEARVIHDARRGAVGHCATWVGMLPASGGYGRPMRSGVSC